MSNGVCFYQNAKAEQVAGELTHVPGLVELSQPTETHPLLSKVCACARSLDSPDLPEHVYFHSLISSVVHIANLDFICLLVGGHHLGSPPSTIRSGGCTDDCYCRAGESCEQDWPRPGHQGLCSPCYPPPHIPSQRPAPPSCREPERQGVPEASPEPETGQQKHLDVGQSA